MLEEPIILLISIVLSIIYKNKLNLSKREKDYLLYASIFILLFLSYLNLLFLIAFIFPILYRKIGKPLILILELLYINLLALHLNPSYIPIFSLINPLIIWLL